MKKSILRIEQQQPRNIQRADIAPETGYSMVVDGHFKTHFSQESSAKKAATELLARYPMLQVEIYDARVCGMVIRNQLSCGIAIMQWVKWMGNGALAPSLKGPQMKPV